MKAGRLWRTRAAATPLLVLLYLAFSCGGADWPQFRGPTHDGVSTERLSQQWTGSVTNPVWLVPLTNCLGTFSVSGGRAYTQTRRAIDGPSKEVCVALSVTNGLQLWATAVDDASYPDGGVGFDDGPRTTPAVDGGSVFVLSSYLKLYRLDEATGAVIWQKDLRALYGGSVINWQNAASPLLDNGLIFLNANCASSNLMALRTSDGEPAWRSQNEPMTHSTPVLANIQGVPQVIFATQKGLVSLDPASGNLLWRFSYPFTYNVALGVSPVVYQDMVYVSGAQAYSMGSVVARVSFANDSWTATQLWANTGLGSTLASHWMTPVCFQGFLYGQFGVQSFDSVTAQLKCVDMRTGAVKWSTNNFGRGAVLLARDRLVALTEKGQLVLVAPNTNAYTELGRFQAIANWNTSTNKCWNVPAVSDGRIYVRSTAFAACFDLSFPYLRLDAAAAAAAEQLQLTIRTVSGAPIDSNRLAGIEVRGTTNLTQPPGAWVRLTNSVTSSNGVVRIDNVAPAQPQQFFIVNEPE